MAPTKTAPVALAPVREVAPTAAAVPPPAPVQAAEPEVPPVLAPQSAQAAAPASEQAHESSSPALAAAEGAEDEPVATAGAHGASGEDEPGEPGEPTTAGAGAPVGNEPFFTADLPDEVLKELWKKDPKLLGPISVGFVQSGRMINSIPFPAGEGWDVVWPEKTWTTQETADYLIRAIREVRAQYGRAPIIHVNQISAQDGGHLRPHKSHQNGRDVDLGFYYRADANDARPRARESVMDMELNWALLKALIVHTDVQMIIVDKRIQKVLHEYALGQGEDPKWLDSLFGGADPLFLHARGHRDHFHVRFFNPRAQELGRRIAPLLALQPEHNLMMHRVRSGDSLGKIAQHYGSSIGAIKKANHMTSILLRIGQTVSVPLHGACTQCPVPPPVNIPPRRLPPTLEQDAPAVAGDPVASAEAPRQGGDSAALPASEPASPSAPEAQPASAMVP